MTTNRNRQRLNQILGALADELDVPPSKYEEAKEHYDAVGTWLGEPDSELAPYDPVIYPQGSFALGTAVRPMGDDDYDVDAVCLLQLRGDQVTQQQLKAIVGRRLKHERSRYKNMIEPENGGRRCWTIRYANASKFPARGEGRNIQVREQSTRPGWSVRWHACYSCAASFRSVE